MNANAYRHLRLARQIATLMDTKYGVGSFRFGLDPVLSILPGVGSAVSAALSLYLVWIAKELNVPSHVYVRMAFHILLDFFLGIVPVFGPVADFFYKANVRNLQLLEEYMGTHIPLEGHLVDAAHT